ncbi:hypothetical protein G7046_g5496 [Stylonectria norvegica]|nr:hypothetical protein G7046_g5496 [Stylonectria norvegica]
MIRSDHQIGQDGSINGDTTSRERWRVLKEALEGYRKAKKRAEKMGKEQSRWIVAWELQRRSEQISGRNGVTTNQISMSTMLTLGLSGLQRCHVLLSSRSVFGSCWPWRRDIHMDPDPELAVQPCRSLQAPPGLLQWPAFMFSGRALCLTRPGLLLVVGAKKLILFSGLNQQLIVGLCGPAEVETFYYGIRGPQQLINEFLHRAVQPRQRRAAVRDHAGPGGETALTVRSSHGEARPSSCWSWSHGRIHALPPGSLGGVQGSGVTKHEGQDDNYDVSFGAGDFVNHEAPLMTSAALESLLACASMRAAVISVALLVAETMCGLSIPLVLMAGA